MNETVTKILLAGDNSYLSQPGFIYSACRPCTKNKKKKKKVLKKEDIHDILIKNWTRNHSCKIMI